MKKCLIKIFKSIFVICIVNSNLINLRLKAEQTASNSLLTLQNSSERDGIREPENKDNNVKNNIVISGIKYIKDSYIPLVEKLVNKNPNEWDSFKKEALNVLNLESLVRLDKALKWINFKSLSITDTDFKIHSSRLVWNYCSLVTDLVKTDPSNWNKYEKRKQELINDILLIKQNMNDERKKIFATILAWFTDLVDLLESSARLEKAVKWIVKDIFKEESITDTDYNDRSIKFAKDVCDLIIDLFRTDPSKWRKYEERRQKLRDDFLFIKKHLNDERERIFDMVLKWTVNIGAAIFNENIFFSIFPMFKVKTYVCYTVKEGDTLSKIALEHNTTVEYIALMNNIKNINLIYPGQVLKI